MNSVKRGILERHPEKSRIVINAHSFFTSKDFYWLFLFLIWGLGTGYYCLFSFSIAMPQMGWWQYFGWRIAEGDIPYKDFYLYLPPYHVLYSAFLYRLFGNRILNYTVFGFFINKLSCWTILYDLLTRRFRPWQVAVGLLAGIVLNSVYLMDLTFDYNPLVTFFWVLLIFLTVRMYELNGRKAFFYAFLAGGVCGILLMTKQNVGLAAPVTFLTLLFFIHKKKKIKSLKCVFLYVLGISTGILPGVFYLLETESFRDAFYCITSAMQAKGTGNGFFITTLRNFWRPAYIATAFAVLSLYFILIQGKDNVKKAVFCIVVAVILGVDTTIYLTPIWNFFNSNVCVHLSTALLFGVLLLSVFIYAIRKKKTAKKIYAMVYLLLIIGGILSAIVLSPSKRQFFYGTLSVFNLRRGSLYVILYLELFLWLRLFIKLIYKDSSINFMYFLIITGMLLYMAVSFTSAPLEELYSVVFVPPIICEALDREIRFNRVKQNLILLIITFTVCLCELEKTSIPYEWHSWKVSALYDQENPMTASKVEGLDGLYLPLSDETVYEEIVRGIEDNSDKDDTLYQFPNIMLFNVLTERKTVYDAVPYFDVCPDSEAEKSAKELEENSPQMVLWSNLNEDRWIVHESQYRNGNLSGQRKLQEWFEDYVKNNYREIGSWDNNEGEGDTISLWKREAFAPGDLNCTWTLEPLKAYFFQNVIFNKDSFDTYVLSISSEQKVEDIPVTIRLLDDKGNIVDETNGEFEKESDGMYSVKIGREIQVQENRTYTLNVELRPGADVVIGRTSDDTATDVVYAFDGKNIFNFNAGIYCE